GPIYGFEVEHMAAVGSAIEGKPARKTETASRSQRYVAERAGIERCLQGSHAGGAICDLTGDGHVRVRDQPYGGAGDRDYGRTGVERERIVQWSRDDPCLVRGAERKHVSAIGGTVQGKTAVSHKVAALIKQDMLSRT